MERISIISSPFVKGQWGVGIDQYNRNEVERMALNNKILAIHLTASDRTEFRTQEESQMIKSLRQNCL